MTRAPVRRVVALMLACLALCALAAWSFGASWASIGRLLTSRTASAALEAGSREDSGWTTGAAVALMAVIVKRRWRR